jgi:glutamine synthetase
VEDVLGAGPRKEYLELKRNEWARYNQHVSDWEIEHYLNFF